MNAYFRGLRSKKRNHFNNVRNLGVFGELQKVIAHLIGCKNESQRFVVLNMGHPVDAISTSDGCL